MPEPERIKVLMISSDRNIFTPGSAVATRMEEYGKLVEELHIVVLSTTSHGLKETKLGENVYVYPTNTATKFLYPQSAASLGKKIALEKKFVRGRSLITAQDPFECGTAGLKVAKKWRLPLEVQLHTDPFSRYFKGALNSVRKKMAQKVLKGATSIRVVSEELKQKLAASSYKLAASISVLPIYIDKERVESGQVKFDVHARFGWHFVMLAVARLTAEKSLGTAIETLARVRAKFPDTGLVIVGDGPELGSLKSLAKKLGVEKGVAFEGWQEDLASYYKTSGVFIQTSLFEGYGMALVEAGLSGLPIVSTPVGIATELENEKELYICPPKSAEIFSYAVLDLLEHNFKRENLRINMKRTLEHKLLSKEEYLKQLKQGWEDASKRVKASV